MDESLPAPSEEFSLGLDQTEHYRRKVAAEIARDRAMTENRIAMVLVVALVASLPVYFVALWLCPGQAEELSNALEKWFTAIGPLAGAAIGFGISHNRSAGARANAESDG